MTNLRANEIDGDIQHMGCGGSVICDGVGKKRVTIDAIIVTGGTIAIYAWYKTYKGGCLKCQEEGIYVITKPYRRSRRLLKIT